MLFSGKLSMSSKELNAVQSFFETYRKWYLSHKDLSLYLDVPGTTNATELHTKLKLMDQQFAARRVKSRRCGVDSADRSLLNASFTSPVAATNGRGYASEIVSRFNGGYQRFDKTTPINVGVVLTGRVGESECFLVDEDEVDTIDLVDIETVSLSITSSRPSGPISQHNVTPLPVANNTMTSVFATRPLAAGSVMTTTAATMVKVAPQAPLFTGIAPAPVQSQSTSASLPGGDGEVIAAKPTGLMPFAQFGTSKGSTMSSNLKAPLLTGFSSTPAPSQSTRPSVPLPSGGGEILAAKPAGSVPSAQFCTPKGSTMSANLSFLNSPAFGDASRFGLLRTSTPLADRTSAPDFTLRLSDVGVASLPAAADAAGSSSISSARMTDKTVDTFRTALDGSAVSGRDSDVFVTAKGWISGSSGIGIARPVSPFLAGPSVGAKTSNSSAKSVSKSAAKPTVKPKIKTDKDDYQPDGNEIFASNFLGGCSLAKWIQHFSQFHDELTSRIAEFEKDDSHKKLRFTLKRSIVDRINFSAKKKASNADVAHALSFFLSLTEGRSVVDSDGVEFTLDLVNRPAVDYVMYAIAQKYLEQVKWDLDLMDTIVLVLISICRNSAAFHDVLCAVVLNASVLLKMSVSKVLDKALSFAQQPPEAAVLWISAERAVFRLFARVQISIKSNTSTVTERGEVPKLSGLDLLHMFLADTLGLHTPVFCASAFIVSELLEHFHKHLAKWEFKQRAGTIQSVELLARWRTAAMHICDYDWAPRLAVIDRRLADTPSVATIARSRHDALLCVLRHAIECRLTVPKQLPPQA